LERHGAKNHVDILCRLSKMDERKRLTNRQTMES